MIKNILNRRFILEQLQAHLDRVEGAGLENQRRDGEAPEGAERLTSDDYEEAHKALADSLTRNKQASTGQPGFDDAASDDDRRAGEAAAMAPSIDDHAFFSRDPVISNFQSALEEYLEERESEAIEGNTADASDDRRSVVVEPAAITERRISGADDDVETDGRRLFEKFSPTDPGWVDSLIAMGITKFRGKHDFVPNLDHVHPSPIAAAC